MHREGGSLAVQAPIGELDDPEAPRIVRIAEAQTVEDSDKVVLWQGDPSTGGRRQLLGTP